MLGHEISALLGATLLLSTGAQAGLMRRQSDGGFTCDGSRNPDMGACTSLLDDNGFCSNPSGSISVDQGGQANELVFGTPDNSGNCIVTVGFNDKTYIVSNQQVCNAYNAVSSTCFPSGAGGSWSSNYDKYQVGFYSDPDYRSSKKREASLEARQQSGDTSFNVGIHSTNIRGPETNIGPAYPGGTQITITEEDTVETSLTFSASVSSDFFGLVSASVGFDVSQSYSSTSSVGVTITINCDSNQVGQLYWTPYLETWFGAFSPSGDQLTVSRPQTDGSGGGSGEYNYRCIE